MWFIMQAVCRGCCHRAFTSLEEEVRPRSPRLTRWPLTPNGFQHVSYSSRECCLPGWYIPVVWEWFPSLSQICGKTNVSKEHVSPLFNIMSEKPNSGYEYCKKKKKKLFTFQLGCESFCSYYILSWLGSCLSAQSRCGSGAAVQNCQKC